MLVASEKKDLKQFSNSSSGNCFKRARLIMAARWPICCMAPRTELAILIRRYSMSELRFVIAI